MNELAIIFDRLGIPTQEVLWAAATKWNFLPFTAGVVAGHCIRVDPSNIGLIQTQANEPVTEPGRADCRLPRPPQVPVPFSERRGAVLP
jgi:hypothetical protein